MLLRAMGQARCIRFLKMLPWVKSCFDFFIAGVSLRCVDALSTTQICLCLATFIEYTKMSLPHSLNCCGDWIRITWIDRCKPKPIDLLIPQEFYQLLLLCHIFTKFGKNYPFGSQLLIFKKLVKLC